MVPLAQNGESPILIKHRFASKGISIDVTLEPGKTLARNVWTPSLPVNTTEKAIRKILGPASRGPFINARWEVGTTWGQNVPASSFLTVRQGVLKSTFSISA
jgi:hypothetical protein